MAKRMLVVALLIIFVGMAAVVQAQEEDEVVGDPSRGAALYAEFCLACHGPQGEAIAGHEAFAADINYSLEFAEKVTEGIAGTYMVAYGEEHDGPLSALNIGDIAAFAGTWGTAEFEPLAEPVVSAELELSEEEALGSRLYQANCVGCHNQFGQGRAKLANFPPIGEHVDVLALARRGVADSVMPPFAQDYDGPLAEEELTAIQAYLRTWDRTELLVAAAAAEPQGVWQLIVLAGLAGLSVVALGVWTQQRRK